MTSYQDVQTLMTNMPAHMFDVPRVAPENANKRGWYFAHIYPAKNGDADFKRWSRGEVERRFLLSLHPCNVFLVPKVPRGEKQPGEDPNVIGFMARQYAKRYGRTWSEFVDRIGGNNLSFPDGFGAERFPCDVQTGEVGRCVSYRATRLTFKRRYIEPLGDDEHFEVITPMGIYRFTKQQFHLAFPNIVQSKSYRLSAQYYGAQLHLKAAKFRVS